MPGIDETNMRNVSPRSDDIFTMAEHLEFGDIHMKIDHKTGLKAITAIHSTALGPALGGCRCMEYPSSKHAFKDAMRLAQAMSYKAAISGLSLGGGKSVIIKPPQISDRVAFFEMFGEFVESLNGRYITAMDSGTDVEDMNVIARKTNYVASNTLGNNPASGDPSPATALGVFYGIQAAVKYKFQRDDLAGIHVCIQGLGHVGYHLGEYLSKHGAKLTICDIEPAAVERFCQHYKAAVVNYETAHQVECDVFAPCALGGVINDKTIEQLRTQVIAGCANNQLLRRHHGLALFNKNILYAPDYVINAGGLIFAENQYRGGNDTDKETKLKRIHARLLEIFERADKEHQATSVIADQLSKELIAAGKGDKV